MRKVFPSFLTNYFFCSLSPEQNPLLASIHAQPVVFQKFRYALKTAIASSGVYLTYKLIGWILACFLLFFAQKEERTVSNLSYKIIQIVFLNSRCSE